MNLIVLCDGTWNTPDQMDGDLLAPTNVVKMWNALSRTDKNGEEQLTYYHPGVGTDGGWWNRIAGGGLGDGLEKNIVSAYNWLARNYSSGAKIWLFGFSRGAYTVRSLGGMISRCGLLNARDGGLEEPEIWKGIEDLFQNYRTPEDEAPKVVASAELPFHETLEGKETKHSIPIFFLGVWDTVGALGIPDDMAILDLIDDPARHSFHDTDLSSIVENARHAVAIDELRQSFTPTLWSNVESEPTVKQLWFPGCHGDVGGGHGRCDLSDGALEWMINECQQLQLGFRDNVSTQLCSKPLGQLHDSVTGIFKALKTRPRAVPSLKKNVAAFHETALERHANVSLFQGEYWRTTHLSKGKSITVDVFAADQWNNTGVFLEKGVTYSLTADGEWLDSSIRSGPKGTKDGEFFLGEAFQIAASAWGKAEDVYTKLTKNKQVDFWYTKRVEAAGWFALIGVVANNFVPSHSSKDQSTYLPHEEFEIGDRCSITPKAGGYLYAYANDTWQTYDNNRGSVRLTITYVEGGSIEK